MKRILVLIFSVLTFGNTEAQNILGFNEVLIITDQVETVPSGKVWKVTGIFGLSDNICYPYFNANFGTVRYALGFGTGLLVNTVTIVNQITDRTGSSHFPNPDCTGSGSTNWNPTFPKIEPNPNVFPMWLPAGTTLRTLGPTTFSSVLEFDVTQ